MNSHVLVGAATFIVGNRLLQDQQAELWRIEPELVELMLTPYVGREEARRIAAEDA